MPNEMSGKKKCAEKDDSLSVRGGWYTMMVIAVNSRVSWQIHMPGTLSEERSLGTNMTRFTFPIAHARYWLFSGQNIRIHWRRWFCDSIYSFWLQWNRSATDKAIEKPSLQKNLNFGNIPSWSMRTSFRSTVKIFCSARFKCPHTGGAKKYSREFRAWKAVSDSK